MSDASHLGLGRLIPEDATQHRDAIHIAVVPARAHNMLRPGQKVILVDQAAGGEPVMAAAHGARADGIADPFLDVPALPGQRLWIYLYPGSIIGLRHEWTHPVFDGT